jgi:two-component system copper resistance phosphate regulon response regulator CusR
MAATRILLVEDDRNTSELLVHVLRSAGYAVDLARNVAEAEQWLIERDYVLVIADWRLPDGDGIVVADRATGLGMKTAVLTGYAFHIAPETAARHEIWMKPMRPIELVAAIERCIDRDERCASN